MKKIILTIITAAMLISAAGCGAKNEDDKSVKQINETAETAATEEIELDAQTPMPLDEGKVTSDGVEFVSQSFENLTITAPDESWEVAADGDGTFSLTNNKDSISYNLVDGAGSVVPCDDESLKEHLNQHYGDSYELLDHSFETQNDASIVKYTIKLGSSVLIIKDVYYADHVNECMAVNSTGDEALTAKYREIVDAM